MAWLIMGLVPPPTGAIFSTSWGRGERQARSRLWGALCWPPGITGRPARHGRARCSERASHWGTDMRVLAASLCAVAALLLQAPASQAQQACAEDALGVSRTLEVDTTGGPWFGEPHGDRAFLARGEVVLTFDDGPAPRSTRSILSCARGAVHEGDVLRARRDGRPNIPPTCARSRCRVTPSAPTPGRTSISSACPRTRPRCQIETAVAAAEKAAGQPIAPFFRYPYFERLAFSGGLPAEPEHRPVRDRRRLVRLAHQKREGRDPAGDGGIGTARQGDRSVSRHPLVDRAGDAGVPRPAQGQGLQGRAPAAQGDRRRAGRIPGAAHGSEVR